MNENNGIPPGSGGVLLWRCKRDPQYSSDGCGNCYYFSPNDAASAMLCGQSVKEVVGVRLPADWQGTFSRIGCVTAETKLLRG